MYTIFTVLLLVLLIASSNAFVANHFSARSVFVSKVLTPQSSLINGEPRANPRSRSLFMQTKKSYSPYKKQVPPTTSKKSYSPFKKQVSPPTPVVVATKAAPVSVASTPTTTTGPKKNYSPFKKPVPPPTTTSTTTTAAVVAPTGQKKSYSPFQKQVPPPTPTATTTPTTAISEVELELLKEQLVDKCDIYKQQQKDQWSSDSDTTLTEQPTQEGLLGAGSFKDVKIIQDELSSEIISLVNQIAKYNPTPNPFESWNTKQTGMNESPLNGVWKLRFTTAADATFKPSKRGEASTYQIANATSGYFLNCIDFPNNKGKTKGFVVHVKGIPKDNKMQLIFEKVVINRISKIPKLFGQLKFRIPNLLPVINFFKKDVDKLPGAYFEMLYLDEDLRIHKTGEDNYFIQTKLHEVWDPSTNDGWTMVSTL